MNLGVLLFFFLSLFFTAGYRANAQTVPLDTVSINSALDKLGDNDSLKCRYILALSDSLRRPQPEMVSYIHRAIEYARHTSSMQLFADAIKQAGFVYYYNGDLPDAALYFEKASLLYDSLGDDNNLLTCYVMLSNHYFYLGQYDKTIIYNLKMIPVAKHSGNIRRLTTAYRQMGVCYLKLGYMDSSYYYINRAIEQAENTNIPLVPTFNYATLADYYLVKKDKSNTYRYYKKALSYCNEADSCLFARTMVYNDLASYFLKYKIYDSAGFYIDKAFENHRILKARAITYKIAAEYYMDIKDYVNAEVYMDSAEYLLDKVRNFIVLDDLYVMYADMYWKLGDAKKSRFYSQKKFANCDSLKKRDFERQSENVESYFELLKFGKTIERLKAAERLRKQRIKRYRVALGVFFAAVLLALLYIYIQSKFVKRLKQKNRIISDHRAEIILQAEKLKEQRDKLEQQNTMINSSLKCALSIQSSTLPLDNQMLVLLHEFYLIYRPMQIVSGDFYWVAKSPDSDSFFAAVADGTGHGVPGAFISLITARLLDEIVLLKNEYQPKNILALLNHEITKLVGKKRDFYETVWGLDIILMRVEKYGDDYKVIFSGAKLPLVYYIPGGKLEYLKTTRRSIGGFFIGEDVDFEESYIIVPQGTVFYLFTDGYKDQVCNETGKRMGTKGFMDLLDRLKDMPVKQQGEELDRFLNYCIVKSEQRDDITVLIFRL